MNEAPKPRFTKSRIWLLVWLIPILVIWAVLILKVPIAFLQNGGWQTLIDRKSQTAKVKTHTGTNSGVQEITFDPQTGAFTCETNPKQSGTTRIKSDSQDNLWRLISVDDEGETTRDIEFEFPGFPRLVNDRFALHYDHTAIWTRDISRPDSELIETPNQSSCFWDKSLKDTRRFVRHNRLVPPKLNNATVSDFMLELFEIDEQANPIALKTWPGLQSSELSRSSAILDDEIVTLNPTSMAIEYHCLDEGRLTQSIPILEHMDPSVQKWFLNSDFFFINAPNGIRHFDLKSRQWIKLPDERYLIGECSPDSQLWLAYDHSGESAVVLIDKESGLEVAKIKNTWHAHFLDNESIICVLPNNGWTFRQFSTQDGSKIKTWTPFWWVLPILLVSIAGYVIWSYLWLCRTGPSSFQVWASIMLLSAVPLLAFVLRTRLVGDTFDLGRNPIQYAQAINFSLLLLSTVWIINSKQRIVIRLLPMIVSLAILSAAVTYTFSEDLRLVAIGIVQMAFPTALFGFVFLVFRRFGYRLLSEDPKLASNAGLSQSAPTQTSASVQEKTSLVTIQDMFLLVGSVALVFATATPLLPSLHHSLGELERIIPGMGHLITGAALQILAWWLVMTGKQFGSTKFIIVAITFLFLLAEPVLRFATGATTLSHWVYGFGLSPELMRVTLSAIVSTYWLGLAFRLGGWRWERISPVPIPEKA